MTFGDYEYGPDEPEEPVDDEPGEVPPDHPLSTVQCDHPNCKNPTPEDQQRICEDCTTIMLSDTPDRCELCGVSLTS